MPRKPKKDICKKHAIRKLAHSCNYGQLSTTHMRIQNRGALLFDLDDDDVDVDLQLHLHGIARQQLLDDLNGNLDDINQNYNLQNRADIESRFTKIQQEIKQVIPPSYSAVANKMPYKYVKRLVNNGLMKSSEDQRNWKLTPSLSLSPQTTTLLGYSSQSSGKEKQLNASLDTCVKVQLKSVNKTIKQRRLYHRPQFGQVAINFRH
ncbi:unnamed protein product [Didymodactylos carnosus]|uniref:Uncharacterized protein n=1 Tax=Didymodactylos carnosus TaxID=1234261 RepID=A0A8S2TZG2_9BILA|nr:unnamed protein product [Didymodactylos carnosus]